MDACREGCFQFYNFLLKEESHHAEQADERPGAGVGSGRVPQLVRAAGRVRADQRRPVVLRWRLPGQGQAVPERDGYGAGLRGQPDGGREAVRGVPQLVPPVLGQRGLPGGGSGLRGAQPHRRALD